MRWFPLLALAASCSSPPDPCTPMCAAATELYGGCLESWGVEWTSAGYDDAAHFEESCETWAWTTRLLEEEAGRSGEIDALCQERRKLFEDGECDDFTDINWSELPWQPAGHDTGRP